MLERNTHPRVSIIVPTYNRASFIGEAVASAFAQSFSDFELIIVDDGSTDKTRSVLESIRDSRLHCIFQDNGGRSRARNAALKAARGEYIAFLDSDDVYLPCKLERQVAYLDENRDVGMVYTAASCIDSEGRSLHYTYQAPLSGRIYPHIAFFQPLTIALPTVMMRRSVLNEVGLFDEAMERFEDTDMWRRVARRHRIDGLDEVTCLVRTHGTNELRSQNPSQITAAIEYYVAKVIREDREEIDESVLLAGARRLFSHYGEAMQTVPEFAQLGQELIERGKRYFAPLVSIVIPVYNGGDYLREAIESALQQTYWNTEVIVVNDGSTDGGATERIALSYGDRIRYVAKPNGGVATALNAGVAAMRGDYFSWLSHDDLYVRDKIERQVDLLAQQPEPSSTVVYGDYSVFTNDPKNGHDVALRHVDAGDFRFFITTENVLHGCTLLVPRGAFERHGSFDVRLRTTQDYDLWFRMAAAERFVHSSGVVVHARSHAEQGTIKMKDVVLDECEDLLSGFVERLSIDDVERCTSCPAPAAYFELASDFYRRGFPRTSRRALDIGRDATIAAATSASEKTVVAIADMVWDLAFKSAQATSEINNLRTRLDQATSAYRAEHNARAADTADLRRQLYAVHASSSWRITAPLRRLAGWRALRRILNVRREPNILDTSTVSRDPDLA